MKTRPIQKTPELNIISACHTHKHKHTLNTDNRVWQNSSDGKKKENGVFFKERNKVIKSRPLITGKHVNDKGHPKQTNRRSVEMTSGR